MDRIDVAFLVSILLLVGMVTMWNSLNKKIDALEEKILKKHEIRS